jgi:hypothetical protein
VSEIAPKTGPAAVDLAKLRVRARTRAKISLVLWLTPVLVAAALWLTPSNGEWSGLKDLVLLFLGPFLLLPFSLVGLVFALLAIRWSERPILWILGVSLNGLSVAAAAAVLLSLSFS